MVSVVITAFNVEKYIRKSIESVFNQTYKDIETIIVNDCSQDSTSEILDSIEGIKIINNKENLGAGMSRRIGIQNAIGDFVLLLDADDWLEPDCIENLVNAQKEHDSDMTGCNIRIIILRVSIMPPPYRYINFILIHLIQFFVLLYFHKML